jgi:hypothetical protein
MLLVRAFFLDPVEELGWRMFWSGIGNGSLMDLSVVVHSTTFTKCACGFAVVGLGAALGTWLGFRKPA